MEVGRQSLTLISLKEWLEFYPSAGLFSVFEIFFMSRHAILASICGTQLEKDLGKISASAEPSGLLNPAIRSPFFVVSWIYLKTFLGLFVN